MKRNNKLIVLLLALFVVLMGLPFLVPRMGALSLIAFVPLLCAERIATQYGIKKFFWWYFSAFLAFNFLCTGWVCIATIGGGIFANLYTAFVMSAIFAVFRISKKRFNGVIPYIFLAVMWIAWERFNLVEAQASWPWLVLGNAFAYTPHLVQWYEYTGLLGGSLWIWVTNLSIFGILVSLSDGRILNWNGKAKIASVVGLAIAIMGPVVLSKVIYSNYLERDDAGCLDVALVQPSFTPDQKLVLIPQSKQIQRIVELAHSVMDEQTGDNVTLLMFPETLCSDIWLDDVKSSSTWNTFNRDILQVYPNVNLIFGASTHKAIFSRAKPDILARPLSGGNGWYLSYNSAFVTDHYGRVQYTNKSKLVPGAEVTPYPSLIVPVDDMIGGFAGRMVPQGYADNLEVVAYDLEGHPKKSIPVGVPICYESVYPEFCAQYVQKGAVLLAEMSNDSWWANSSGRIQHFNYCRLRAIELRRDVVRSVNTGVTVFVNQKGDVLKQVKIGEEGVLRSSVNLTSVLTFYAKYGDIVGRICTMMFVFLLLALVVKSIVKK